MFRMKRSVIALILMLLTGATLALAQDSDLANVDPSGQTVVYWHQFRNENQSNTMNQIIEDFNSTNEWGITVEPLLQGGYTDIRNLMSTSIISGELPNIVAGYQNDAASYYADNAAVDLRPYINDPTWGLTADELANINPALITANTFNIEPFTGEILAWPHQFSAQVLVSNLTMLNELGYDGPPETYEEFREIACAASQMTGPNGEDIQGYTLPVEDGASEYEVVVASMGGAIFHDGAYDFTSDAAIGALQLYQDLYNQGCGYITDRPFGNTGDFALGLNPIATTSTAGLPIILNDIATNGTDMEWTVTTLPSVEGSRTLQVYVPSIVMVSSTPEQQLASWLFMKYLVTPDAAATWSESTAYFNATLSTMDTMNPDNFNPPELFPYFDAANRLQTGDVNIYVAPSMVSYGTVRGLIAEAIANVTVNGEDVQTVAENLEAEANEVHEESMAG